MYGCSACLASAIASGQEVACDLSCVAVQPKLASAIASGQEVARDLSCMAAQPWLAGASVAGEVVSAGGGMVSSLSCLTACVCVCVLVGR